MSSRKIRDAIFVTLGLATGAGLMFLLDPKSGHRRRAITRDRSLRWWHENQNVVRKSSRDLARRARGAVLEARKRWTAEDVADEVLIERVRAAMGREVSHSGAITVGARGGLVILSGMILPEELPSLIERVRRVRGVKQIEDRLQAHSKRAAS